jgi:hypothetical protein
VDGKFPCLPNSSPETRRAKVSIWVPPQEYRAVYELCVVIMLSIVLQVFFRWRTQSLQRYPHYARFQTPSSRRCRFDKHVRRETYDHTYLSMRTCFVYSEEYESNPTGSAGSGCRADHLQAYLWQGYTVELNECLLYDVKNSPLFINFLFVSYNSYTSTLGSCFHLPTASIASITFVSN